MSAKLFDFMGKDHDKLDHMFEECRKLIRDDNSEAQELFLSFKSGLEMHITWEEELLFPLYERETGMHDVGPTAIMRMEHRHIENILEEIGSRLMEKKLEGMGDVEADLLGTLGSHNQKEENILYPAIDQLLGEHEKEDVISRMIKMLPGTLV